MLRQFVDVIVAHIEVNDRHGVGVMLERLFGSCPDILSIRSRDYFEGRQDFGIRSLCISHSDASSEAVLQTVRTALGDTRVDRIICVPFFADDVRSAIAIHEISGAPMCTYLMDDQNLYADGIPDELISALLEKSALRLAISGPLQSEYAQKFGFDFAFMPPVAPARLIPNELIDPATPPLHHREAIVLGNIWGIQWVQALRHTLRTSGLKIRWCNHGDFSFWMKENLDHDGFILHPDDESDEAIVDRLRHAAFSIVPSGMLDETDDRRFIAKLSLPSRIPFISATSHAPILVMGSPDTAAARFVTGTGIGTVVSYDPDAVQEAVLKLWEPDVNRAYREAALRLSHRLSDEGAADWIWQSLAKGARLDDRYENLFHNKAPGIVR
jgi:hypothetical protein